MGTCLTGEVAEVSRSKKLITECASEQASISGTWELKFWQDAAVKSGGLSNTWRCKVEGLAAPHPSRVWGPSSTAMYVNPTIAHLVELSVDLVSVRPRTEDFPPADATAVVPRLESGRASTMFGFHFSFSQLCRSNARKIKPELFLKISFEAFVLTEQAGLFPNFVACNDATWNWSMWESFWMGGVILQFKLCLFRIPVMPCDQYSYYIFKPMNYMWWHC